MKNQSPHGDTRVKDAIAEQAASWFVENREGPLTREQRDAFSAWLAESPVHIEEYFAIALLSRDLPAALAGLLMEDSHKIETAVPSRAEIDTANVVELPWISAPRTGHTRNSHTALWRVAAAIMLATLLLTTGSTWLSHDKPWLGSVVQTQHGEQRFLALEDGSLVQLNSDTRLRVQLKPDERRIVLERGQALFEVAHDAARPFRVFAHQTEVTAIGTKFEVRRLDGGETLVTVVQGKVSVDTVTPGTTEAGHENAADHRLRLGMGESVRVDAQGMRAPTVARNVQNSIAWTQRQIVVDDQTLRDVVAEFNRYTNTPIVLEDDTLANLRIGGVFAAYDTETFLLFIERSTHAQVRRTAHRIAIAGPATAGSN